jgi:ribosomal RNA-processing protein 12
VTFDLVISVFFQVALRCLAQLSGSTNISELFVSLVKRFDLEDTQLESDSQECKTDEVDSKDEESTDTTDELNYRRFATFRSSA